MTGPDRPRLPRIQARTHRSRSPSAQPRGAATPNGTGRNDRAGRRLPFKRIALNREPADTKANTGNSQWLRDAVQPAWAGRGLRRQGLSGREGGITDPDYLRTVDAFAEWFREQPDGTGPTTYVVPRIFRSTDAEHPGSGSQTAHCAHRGLAPSPGRSLLGPGATRACAEPAMARADRQRCRHRLGNLLLRRGLHYPGRAWTQATM